MARGEFETSHMVVSHCLNCGRVLDAASGKGSPTQGDLSVCISCGCVMQFDADLKLTGFTEDEATLLLLDEEMCGQLRRAVGVVKLWRGRN